MPVPGSGWTNWTGSTRMPVTEAPRPGTLYVVATPIGNLEDLTLRALRILREVDLVAAEDTRHSRKLFSHYGIATPLTSCFAHNELRKTEEILRLLGEGRAVALISDAGTPAISDPGYLLVKRCREAGHAVVPVPGPSAVITALSASGQPVERFAFEGFLPSRAAARHRLLEQLRDEERTLVFYEAPHRLQATLRDLEAVCGAGRGLTVARELTKLHEEIFRGTVETAIERFGAGRVRGELVLVLAPAAPERAPETVREALLRKRRGGELPPRQLAREVARELGVPGSEVYKEVLKLKAEEG